MVSCDVEDVEIPSQCDVEVYEHYVPAGPGLLGYVCVWGGGEAGNNDLVPCLEWDIERGQETTSLPLMPQFARI